MGDSEVIEVLSSDEEDEKSARKIIGWNYQLDFIKTSKSDEETIPNSLEKKSDDEDIEVVEVKSGLGKLSAFPKSSSRSEIRSFTRNQVQKNINTFFPAKMTGSEKKSSDSVKESSLESSQHSQRSTVNSGNEVKDEVLQNKELVKRLSSERNDSKAKLVSFIQDWLAVKNYKDDYKIKDKITRYYELCHHSYKNSKHFIETVESLRKKLTENNKYVVVKDFLETLKHYRSTIYTDENTEEEAKSLSDGKSEEAELSPEELKKNKKLKKIEHVLKKISAKIKEYDEAEVDWDDDDNSSYMIAERLKRKFVQLDEYYCKLAGCSIATGRPIEKRFLYQGSRYPEINKRITAWVNKYKEFPDYVDVLNLVKKVTKQSKLPLRPETIRVQAQEIFRDVGKLLKDRRERDDLLSIYGYATSNEPDPSEKDVELENHLNDNEKIAKKRLDQVFCDFEERELKEKAEVKRQRSAAGDGASVPSSSSSLENRSEESEQESDEEEEEEEDSTYEHKKETASLISSLIKEESKDSDGELEDDLTSVLGGIKKEKEEGSKTDGNGCDLQELVADSRAVCTESSSSAKPDDGGVSAKDDRQPMVIIHEKLVNGVEFVDRSEESCMESLRSNGHTEEEPVECPISSAVPCSGTSELMPSSATCKERPIKTFENRLHREKVIPVRSALRNTVAAEEDGGSVVHEKGSHCGEMGHEGISGKTYPDMVTVDTSGSTVNDVHMPEDGGLTCENTEISSLMVAERPDDVDSNTKEKGDNEIVERDGNVDKYGDGFGKVKEIRVTNQSDVTEQKNIKVENTESEKDSKRTEENAGCVEKLCSIKDNPLVSESICGSEISALVKDGGSDVSDAHVKSKSSICAEYDSCSEEDVELANTPEEKDREDIPSNQLSHKRSLEDGTHPYPKREKILSPELVILD